MQLNQRDVQQKKNAADIGIGKICGFLARKNVQQKDWALVQWWIHSINKQSAIQPWYSQDFPCFDGFPGFPPHHPPFLKTAGGRAPCATWPGSDPSLEAIVHWWWFTIYGENDERMNMYNLWWKWWLYSVVLIVFVYIYIDTCMCVYICTLVDDD